MNKKQKRMVRRIGIGGGLFALGLLTKGPLMGISEVLMVAAWLAAGHKVLGDAFEKIRARKPFPVPRGGPRASPREFPRASPRVQGERGSTPGSIT